MIRVRQATADDRRFIVPTWVRSFADYAPKQGCGSRAKVLRAHWRIVDAILDNPETRTMVLCSEDSERTLHAWASGTADALHYVYVPPELRGHGFARRVITATLGAYPTALAVSHPWPRKSPRYRWDPIELARAVGVSPDIVTRGAAA
ncbi:MAG TPA: hypothetical protein VEA38_15065 [Terriglobales bacterium]|nr:hypothetical protein [Terriglobales bacterium]